MSEAPERIWAWVHKYNHMRQWAFEILPDVAAVIGAVEYVRADRIAELEAKLAKAVEIAELFSGGVEYDYHGNIIGEEERKAMAELAELTGGTDE